MWQCLQQGGRKGKGGVWHGGGSGAAATSDGSAWRGKCEGAGSAREQWRGENVNGRQLVAIKQRRGEIQRRRDYNIE